MDKLSGLAIVVIGLFAGGCGASVAPGTRGDITARMTSTQASMSRCYGASIDRKGPRTRGLVVFHFKVAPKTGRFERVEVVRDDIGDRVLSQCLVERVSDLKLQKPQDVTVAVTYPVSFEPR